MLVKCKLCMFSSQLMLETWKNIHLRTHGHKCNCTACTRAHPHNWTQDLYLCFCFYNGFYSISGVLTLSLKMCVRSCWLVQRESEKKWMPKLERKISVGLETTVNTIHCLWPWKVLHLKTLQLQYLLRENCKMLKLLCYRQIQALINTNIQADKQAKYTHFRIEM